VLPLGDVVGAGVWGGVGGDGLAGARVVVAVAPLGVVAPGAAYNVVV